MKKYTLNAQKRTLFGKKVKKLRNEGFIPSTIYGKKIKSISISVNQKDFFKVYSEAGETGLVEIAVDKISYPVLIHDVQEDPVSGKVLHVEFYHVDLKEKVKANVPVVAAGISQAVKDKAGILLQITNELEVEALPENLPEKIEIDITGLAKVDDEFKVSDVKPYPGVEILTDKNQILFRIAPLKKQAEEEEKKEPVAPETGAETAASGGNSAKDAGGTEEEKPKQ